MKLECVQFSQPVTVGPQPKTFLMKRDYDMVMKGNFIEIKATRQDNQGVVANCIATIFNVVYFKPLEEPKSSLKNAL